MSRPSTITAHDTISRAQTENVTPTPQSGEAAPGTSRSSPPLRAEFSHLPSRAERKARALAEALERPNINPQLAHYAQRVLDTVANSQPTREISNLDAKNLAILVRTYNAKYPGLNLGYARSPAEFRATLAATHAPSWRSIAILDPTGSHRIAIDVRTHDDGHKSLLVMETAQALKRGENNQPLILNGYQEFIANLKDKFGTWASMAIIDVGAQKSKIGCQQFCFDFALHAFHKSDFFDDLHLRLHDYGQCFADGDKAEHIDGMEYIRGMTILPAVFFKHAESRATIKGVLGEQPDVAEKDVSTNRYGTSETLHERVRAFGIKRGAMTYSMSIEASRIRKIREAIENDPGPSSP
ncbi:YopJ family type III secretion system effector XopJ [Collimonas fungivorans]|uniref:YopJ family type III secretion system effector XopJ n=1 Tax=Collimonas fungivorans TaxID=158899 RepID=UPI003FA36D8D